jgi:hypothetical protein
LELTKEEQTMIQPLSNLAEVYDLDKMTLLSLEEAQSLKDKSIIIPLHTVHLWINKHNVLEFYFKPDVRKLDLKKKHFILVRFLGSYCDEHEMVHPGTLSDDQIRYLAHFLLCMLAGFMPIALLKETKFRLTVKMVQDVQFIEMNKNRSNPFDLSKWNHSQTMDANTYQTKTNQLIVDTELICNQVRQFKDNLYRMIVNEPLFKYIDQHLQ